MTIDASYLYTTENWIDTDKVHELFAKMRAESPVHRCEVEGYPTMWHITKHKDIFDIERRTNDFLNEPRILIAKTEEEEANRKRYNGALNPVRSLVTYDAPEHMKLRLLTAAWFMPKNLGKLKGRIDGSVQRGINTLIEKQGECDFAKDVSLEYPLRVIMSVLGIPESDYGIMLRLTQELFGPEDPDASREGAENMTADEAIAQTIMELFTYFGQLTEEKVKNPSDDVATLIANAVVDGEPLDMAAKLGYYIIIATAGHDTTSYSLTQAVYHLAKDPALFDRLKSNPEEVAPLLTEEAIRYASAVRHFIRTANKDTEVGGKTIKEGESVILWYPSGSRDEDIFDDPNVFDIDRSRKTRHAAFGHGAHMCLGMNLARMEINSFLIALAEKAEAIELTSEPKYMQANFVGGIKSLPVKVTLK